MKKELIRIIDANKKILGRSIFKDFYFNAFKGEIIYMIGLSESARIEFANILHGNSHFDSGIIYVNEILRETYSKQDSNDLGIVFISNRMKLIPELSIAENIFVIKNNGLDKILFNKKAIVKEADILLKEMGMQFSSGMKARELTGAQQNIIELIKTQIVGAKLIILDDITHDYTTKEYRQLIQILRILKNKGVSILIQSMRMGKLISEANRTMIIKSGKVAKTFYDLPISESLVHKILTEIDKPKNILNFSDKKGKIIFRVENLVNDKLAGVSLSLREGEVLGLFDEEYEDNYALYEAVFGYRGAFSGNIFLDNKLFIPKNIKTAKKRGIGLLPQEIAENGIIPNLSILENVTINIWDKMTNFSGVIKKRYLEILIKDICKALNISKDTLLSSAYNADIYTLQKAAFHRWIMAKPKMVFLLKPFSSVDAISRDIIIEQVENLSNKKIGTVVISSNLEEIVNLCDRVIFFSHGKIKMEFEKSEFDELSLDLLKQVSN